MIKVTANLNNKIKFHGQVDTTKERSVILIHGFSNNETKALNAYDMMKAYYESRGFVVYGFIWPSNGYVGARSYISDFRRARNAKHGLRQTIAKIKLANEQEHQINIQCHSMGSVVAMECLNIIESGMIHRIAIHGGDATRNLFKDYRKYGDDRYKLNAVLNLYSENDMVLSKAAKLFRPVKRVGEEPLPSSAPVNWSSVDAEAFGGGIVRHNSYKSDQGILNYTAEWLRASA